MDEAKATYDDKKADTSATEEEKKAAEAAYNTAKTEYDAAAAAVTATSSQLALAKQGLPGGLWRLAQLDGAGHGPQSAHLLLRLGGRVLPRLLRLRRKGRSLWRVCALHRH